jgi:hypothetical protein
MSEAIRLLNRDTGSSEQTVRTQCDARAPTVLVVGGMDTLPTPRILATWVAASGEASLPDHRVVVATLLRGRDDPSRSPHPLELAVELPARASGRDSAPTVRYSRAERVARRVATSLMRWADERAAYDDSGVASNLVGAAMGGAIALPLKYLYDPRHESAQRARIMALLAEPRLTTIVGCSFGGSVALDCLIRAFHAGAFARERRLQLLTLGTNLGQILTRSSLYRGLPRDVHGKIALPPNVRWKHFVSASDVFVGASARPRAFSGCEQVEVETGPLLVWPPNRAHGMGRYLATPEVRQALREALSPSVDTTRSSLAATGS